MISDAGGSVFHMHDSARLEAVLFDEVAHGVVVLMGIDAQVAPAPLAKGHAALKDALGLAVSRHPVDDAVGPFFQPRALLNLL